MRRVKLRENSSTLKVLHLYEYFNHNGVVMNKTRRDTKVLKGINLFQTDELLGNEIVWDQQTSDLFPQVLLYSHVNFLEVYLAIGSLHKGYQKTSGMLLLSSLFLGTFKKLRGPGVSYVKSANPLLHYLSTHVSMRKTLSLRFFRITMTVCNSLNENVCNEISLLRLDKKCTFLKVFKFCSLQEENFC